jgi:tetratricopeptide (TPR) repeat protein
MLIHEDASSGYSSRTSSIIQSLVTAVLLLLPFFISSQEEKDIDWYYEEAREAIYDEHYEYAVEIIKEAKQTYPDSAKFPVQLGDLYFNKDFFELALDEYLLANHLNENDFDILDKIQECYGYLNQEGNAIRYLEQILEEYPPGEYLSSIDTVDDLGWMYFKTHQLEKGEELILNFFNNNPEYKNKRGLTMTLGTLYSGMYDYERSKKYYLASIEDAEEDMDFYFASVAYYNLSLLEHTFYHFNSALQYANNSLQSQDRATGHLSRGELYQSQMNFPQALKEYKEGEKKDETPLTKMNTVILLRLFGKIDEALQYAQTIYKDEDQSWMHYFGTDVTRYKKEVHEILADIYHDMARRELSLPGASAGEDISYLLSYIQYSLTSYYHRQKFKNHCLDVGKNYLGEGSYLDAFWEFYRANKEYPVTALKYLSRAEEIETDLIPQSRTYYIQERGIITKNPALLKESINKFDPFWEKEEIAESLVSLIRLLPRGKAERRDAINRLYDINPGAFLSNGIGLPLEVRFTMRSEKRMLKRIILHALKAAGSDTTTRNSLTNEEKGFRYILHISWDKAGSPSFILSDRQKEIVIKEASIQLKKGSIDEQAVWFIRDLLVDHVYYVEEN